MNKIIKKIKNQILDNKIVIACSGGSDSMVLLELCLKALNKDQIIVAHVNHGVRVESEAEETYIIEYCKEHELCLEVKHLDKLNGNFEEAAREKRYEFFNEIAEKYQAKYILLAHHANDNLETIIMRFLRSSSLKGYAGIEELSKYKNKYLYRPLIDISKVEILDYARTNNIQYFDDYTNFEDDHTRNRIRKYIVPELEKENPSIYSAVRYYSDTLLGAESLVLDLYKDFKFKYISIFDDIKINLSELLKLNPYLQREIVFRTLRKYELSSDSIDEIMKNIHSDNMHVVIKVNKELSMIKEYGNLIFTTKDLNQESFYLEINEPGTYILPYNQILIVDKNYCFLNTETDKLCYNNISLPLIIRNRVSGDKLKRTSKNKQTNEIKTFKQSVSDYLTNKKVPLLKRRTLYILEDKNKKIIVLGLKNS